MITGKITVQDYLAAQWLHRKRPAFVWMAVFVVGIVIGICFILAGLELLATIFLVAGGGGLGGLITSFFAIPWQARRLFKQQKDFESSFTYKWDEEFVYGEGESGYSKRPWRNYAKFKEDEKLFLLYHSDVLFEMLPKRWFQNAVQVEQFHAAIQNAKRT